jgi:hypothetical protein
VQQQHRASAIGEPTHVADALAARLLTTAPSKGFLLKNFIFFEKGISSGAA